MGKRPISLGSGHLDTLIPFFFRPVRAQQYERERINTEDDDFLDLDWIKSGHKNLLILNHGFESCSQAQYIQSMSEHFRTKEFDILAWNYRSCSGEMNNSAKFYHSGSTYDLETVINHALAQGYEDIHIIGFSMGGNLALRYAGELGDKVPAQVKTICTFSTPCCLKASSYNLQSGFNRVYTLNFLKTLKQKLRLKRVQLEELGIDVKKALGAYTLPYFDDLVTAPVHGFKDSADYYAKASSKYVLKDIKIPTLIVNAKNDPFLAGECYPHDYLGGNSHITLETPEFGGHVGFYHGKWNNTFWSERRAEKFIQQFA